MLKFYNAQKYIDGTNWNLESMGDTSSNYHPAAFFRSYYTHNSLERVNSKKT